MQAGNGFRPGCAVPWCAGLGLEAPPAASTGALIATNVLFGARCDCATDDK